MIRKPLKISIIIPTLNQAQFITKTIDSVLLQKYPNLEIIVMDGGSSDDTMAILRKYSKKIKWYCEKDKGQTNALNKGFKMATGDILGYINSDDLYFPNTFIKVSDFFNNNKDIMWTTGLCEVIDDKNIKISSGIVKWKNYCLKIQFSQKWQFNLLLTLNFISQPATFWRRNVWQKIGQFDESLKYTMDYDYWLRILQKYPLGIIDSYFASFRMHTRSKTTKFKSEQLDEGYKVIKKYTNSVIAKILHRFHDYVTLGIYKLLY